MRARFGPKDANGLIDFNWSELDTKYEVDYVHPSGYDVDFDGCPTSQELSRAEAGQVTVNSYQWDLVDTSEPPIVAASLSPPRNTCLFSHQFPRLDTYRVKITVIPPNPADETKSFVQSVKLTDILIAAIGDSYGSGEGSPDVPQIWEYDPVLGIPLHVKSGPRWQDARCHRSAAAPSARVALAVEAADPHSSVTYLSFACSGATINTRTAPEDNPLDPYDSLHWKGPRGTGILGESQGTEAPIPGQPAMLPSQIDQLVSAVRDPRDPGKTRKIHALLASAGGNDAGFARIASVCLLVHHCRGREVINNVASGQVPLERRFAEDLLDLHQAYDQFANTLDAAEAQGTLDIDKMFITEYPDFTRDDSGGYCGSILGDVIPPLSQAIVQTLLLPALPIQVLNGVFPPFLMSNDPVFGEEVKWASDVVAPGINTALHAAAERHGEAKGGRVPWESVTGISDEFKQGHGYCASDRWVRTAAEAAFTQGPPAGPLFWTNHKTKGTLHLNPSGYDAVARHLVAEVSPHLKAQGLLSPPPPTRQAAPFFDTSTQGTLGANGWLVTPVGMEVSAVDDTGIQGAELSVNGAVGCPPEIPRMTCEEGHREIGGLSEEIDEKTYVWSLGFGAGGVYQLAFRAEDFGGQISSFSRELKVDLENPTATASASAAPPSGWYRQPVEVALHGSDSTSGVHGIEYALDGAPFSLVAPGSGVTVSGDGTHTLAYRAVDRAGRKSADQALTLRIDMTPPTITCGSPDGVWHPADASIACTASDGLSGLASDASFSLATSVGADTETADAVTATRSVCDVAGNCQTAGPVTGNKVDRKAPTISIASPTVQTYVFGQTLTASYSCADGGSGVGLCSGTTPDGATLDTSSLGPRTFTVDAGDAVGNATSSIVSYVVDRALTATALSSSANPSVFGGGARFTAGVAVVAPGSGSPTGAVQFRVDGHDFGGPVPLDASGRATSPTIAALQVGSHTVTATYSGDKNFKGSTGTLTQLVVCTVNRTNVSGSLVVPSGTAICVTGPSVRGGIHVQAGGALYLTNTTVNGVVSATGAKALTICGSRVNGALSISGTSGFVLLGCGGNTLRSSLNLQANHGGFLVSDNTVSGSFQVTDNTLSTDSLDPSTAPAGHVIKGNSIGGVLSCSGNAPPPTNDGTSNDARRRAGQCSAWGF